jgi:hypothetical protein
VKLDVAASVRASLQRSLGPLRVLQAKIIQNGQVKATATAKFMARERFGTPGLCC